MEVKFGKLGITQAPYTTTGNFPGVVQYFCGYWNCVSQPIFRRLRHVFCLLGGAFYWMFYPFCYCLTYAMEQYRAR